MHRQELCGARGQLGGRPLRSSIRHDVLIVPEVMVQSEGMSQFMRGSKPVPFAVNHRPSAALATGTASMGGSATDIHDNQHYVFRVVECTFNLAFRIASAAIMTVAVVPIDAVNDGIALIIGFDPESRVSISKRLHLLAKERLKIENPRFHRIDHLGAIRSVVWQKVEEPHGAGLAHVQVRSPLARGTGLIALPMFGIDRQGRDEALATARGASKTTQMTKCIIGFISTSFRTPYLIFDGAAAGHGAQPSSSCQLLWAGAFGRIEPIVV